MRSLSEINDEINKWVIEKHRYSCGWMHPKYTYITDIIKDLYTVRDIITNNNIDEAFKIITEKRRKLVDRKKEYDMKFDNLTLCEIRNDISNTIQLYNWILGKDEFDYD